MKQPAQERNLPRDLCCGRSPCAKPVAVLLEFSLSALLCLACTISSRESLPSLIFQRAASKKLAYVRNTMPAQCRLLQSYQVCQGNDIHMAWVLRECWKRASSSEHEILLRAAGVDLGGCVGTGGSFFPYFNCDFDPFVLSISPAPFFLRPDTLS